MEPTNSFTKLLNSLKDKKATIGIIGMGYVGLPLAIEITNIVTT